MLHELGYADNMAFLADTVDKLRIWAKGLQRHYDRWGLVLSVEKN